MGVSLEDMNVWNWMYEHPEATSDELKHAVISIAKDILNKYYAAVSLERTLYIGSLFTND